MKKNKTFSRRSLRNPKPVKALTLEMPAAVAEDWKLNLHAQSGQPIVKATKLKRGLVFCLGLNSPAQSFPDLLERFCPSNQKNDLEKQNRDVTYFVSEEGPVWILKQGPRAKGSEGSFVEEAPYVRSRDQIGSLVPQWKAHQVRLVEIHGLDLSKAETQGLCVGLELGHYSFKDFLEVKKDERTSGELHFWSTRDLEFSAADVRAWVLEGQAINWARHLVNLPPNIVNPLTVSNWCKKQKWSKEFKVEVWDQARLAKESFGLHLAVGQASKTPSQLVRISYRPRGPRKSKPWVFVGKGVTFDTGGLDIKPSAGMRLMKKDMGGVAALLGLARWIQGIKLSIPCDFYLCLAENSIGSKSFRPSDVLRSRGGQWVEVDNTDAEGRLVMADSLAHASEQEAQGIIDVSTLTGAIKVALGSDIAGLFSNSDELSQELHQAGLSSGDYNWRMPLVDRYFASLNSPFADFKNSGEGFGGAITAALFLQKFVGAKAWAHLDIYAWTDKPQGALQQTGGSGQGVQVLIEFLKKKQEKTHY